MATLYPLDFHRRVEGRSAERMRSAAVDAYGSAAHAHLAGQRANEVPAAREALDPLSKSDA
jgi:hypothetical protein